MHVSSIIIRNDIEGYQRIVLNALGHGRMRRTVGLAEQREGRKSLASLFFACCLGSKYQSKIRPVSECASKVHDEVGTVVGTYSNSPHRCYYAGSRIDDSHRYLQHDS